MRLAKRTLLLWLLVLIISGCGDPGKGVELKLGDPDAPPPKKQQEEKE